MVFCVRLDGFRIYFIKSLGKKIFHSQAETAKIPEIYDPHCFRYPSADVCNEFDRDGDPFFCKYICPRVLKGYTSFTWKCCHTICIWESFFFKCFILITVVVLSILFYRPFCKWICPLGAIYSLFNKVSLKLRLKTANVSDAISVPMPVKWMLMCSRPRIIRMHTMRSMYKSSP